MNVETLTTSEARQLLKSGNAVGNIRLTHETVRILEAEGMDVGGRMGWAPRPTMYPSASPKGVNVLSSQAESPAQVIHDLCALAGKPEAEAGYLAKGLTPSDVRTDLLYAACPEETPIVKEATRLAAKHTAKRSAA